jgi:hypothetical protein
MKFHSKNNSFICLGALYLILNTLVACKSDKPQDVKPQEIITVNNASDGVFITNEGNYGFGNAAISYYDIERGEVVEDFYKSVNKKSLGDVCQSAYLERNKMYVVVNNSQKIEVLDSETFVQIATISGFTSPRYILPVSKSKAYVTELYEKAIKIVDLNTHTITGKIEINSDWSVQMVEMYGKVFVGTVQTDKLFVINSATNQVVDSVLVGYNPSSMKEDKFGKLWVLCRGNKEKAIKGKLVQLNPENLQIEKEFIIENDNPARLEINGFSDTLYFLNNGVYQFPVTASSLPTNPIIEENNKLYFGLGIHPKSGQIYVADAIDYVQKGNIYRYKPNGELVTQFKAGIIPSYFVFR